MLFRIIFFLVTGLIICLPDSGGAVDFTSSNLPIIVLNTNGQTILDEPKIPATMGIIYNGPDLRNQLSDPFNDFNGSIGIEVRGQSSQSWPKKQYALETWDASQQDVDVSLLGLPAESDWVLYAPYIDRSLMRNVLTYQLAREMGRYASRCRFVELILNGEYQGVYVLMEKIKRDKNRVDIAKLEPHENSGDDLTGGYILKIDKPGDPYFVSAYPPPGQPYGASYTIDYQYEYPDPDDISSAQEIYIQSEISAFEDMVAGDFFSDPDLGYSKYISTPAFIDFLLSNELAKNVDGYRLSTFMFRDKDSKGGLWNMGPLWDFNLGYGNANYYGADHWNDFELELLKDQIGSDGFQVPFWWYAFFEDSAFTRQTHQRWQELRQNIFSEEHIFSFIDHVADTLNEAQQRNFEIWVGPGEYGGGFWPVPDIFYTFSTYQDEVDYLKEWIGNRLAWMDEHLDKRADNVLKRNLARGSAVFTSGNETCCGNGDPARVRDGKTYTRWSSGWANNQWIYIDLGQKCRIDRVVLSWAQEHYGRIYRLEVSDNAQTWTQVHRTTNGNGVIDDRPLTNASGRYIRMYGEQRNSDRGFSLWEFKVFGEPLTALPDEEKVIPSGFRLLTNYPNPFNPQTKIRFSMDQPAKIRIEIFDTAGKLVLSAADGWYPAGQHELNFESAGLSGGVYICRLTNQNGDSVSGKMVMLK